MILLPMGAADDGAHSQNEKIDIRLVLGTLRYHIDNKLFRNYIEGTKLLGAYAYQLSQL